MGNAMGRGSRRSKRTAKVMKINGETFKIRTPTTASQVTTHHPNHLLYDSQSITQLGLRAKPLDPHHQLKPKTLYFLLHLPPLPGSHRPLSRVRSDLCSSASDRLECLMLSRRSLSDLQSFRLDPDGMSTASRPTGPVQIKLRVPREEFERLMKESKSKVEAVERIVDLWKTGGMCSGQAREVRFLAVLDDKILIAF
ncbi:uncharacterized protein At1g66480-like [Cucurbita pepo subsp. pepo]|uniref:uncharacterized protein At1g66480-like n=1 Tax=Cucurbita pepo subsp. pepo TaxID=3664 RepID=UPI000C9D4226|nr:uncharacterized protein At1g66480-like [Cucurbita pepo subsp. pepo]